MTQHWESIHLNTSNMPWKPASEENFVGLDGQEYGQWVKVLRNDGHALTLISKFKAPKGKAWRLVAKAPELGEDVYILEGEYLKVNGEVLAQAGEYMFYAPHAPHGGFITEITILVHWCSGQKDYDKKFELVDFKHNR